MEKNKNYITITEAVMFLIFTTVLISLISNEVGATFSETAIFMTGLAVCLATFVVMVNLSVSAVSKKISELVLHYKINQIAEQYSGKKLSYETGNLT